MKETHAITNTTGYTPELKNAQMPVNEEKNTWIPQAVKAHFLDSRFR